MRLAVTSPSFSRNETLVNELKSYFPDARLNVEGLRFDETELIDYLKDCDAAIVGLDQVNANVLSQLPSLKIVSKYGVGLDNIDKSACEKYNVAIGWTGGVNRLSVAEMALGNMLSLARNLYTTSLLLKDGNWHKDGGYQISGKTIGIVGVGFIGKEVIRLLQPFNCEILVNDIIEQDAYYAEVGATVVTKEELFERSDIVTIHTPLTDETRNLMNADVFQKMKASSFVINTARGGIINEEDLKTALIEGQIAGAAIDVYLEEPPVDTSLLKLNNLICTPHIGGNSKEAVLAMGMSAIENLKTYFNL